MKDVSKIKEQVLKSVSPSEKEREETWKLFEDIKSYIKDEFGLEANMMGSVSKNTFLKGNKDLDIFVFFPEDKDVENLEERGLEIGKSVFDKFDGEYEVDYAEHPYTKGLIDGFEVEIIPCYNVDTAEELKSSVDRTPFHTKWINDNLSEDEKEEVIILKAFLQARELYGSSLKVEGFSGYLCELLIAEYGSFEKLLEASQEWTKREKIDPGDHWKEKDEIKIPKEVWGKFKEDSFILIDPVDSGRNVASVLSEENFAKFIYEAGNFLKNPSKDFFKREDEEYSKEEIEKTLEDHGKVLVLEFKKPDLIDDILYPQLRRSLKRIENKITRNEFELFETGIYTDEEHVRLVLDFKVWKLPKARKHVGPQVYHNRDHLDQFKDKYEQVWIEDSRVVTINSREHRKARDLLEDFLNTDSEELKRKGISKDVAENLVNYDLKNLKKPDSLNGSQNWLCFLGNFLKVE